MVAGPLSLFLPVTMLWRPRYRGQALLDGEYLFVLTVRYFGFEPKVRTLITKDNRCEFGSANATP